MRAIRPAGWAAAATLVPILAVDPGGLAPFGPVKWALLPALVLAALAGVMGRPRRLPPAVTRAGLAFLALAALSAAFGVDRLYAWIGTPDRHFGFLTWLLCAAACVVGTRLSRGESRTVATAGAATAAALGVWAGAEALGWEPMTLVGAGSRPIGPLGSSAFLGAAAVLLTPLAIGLGRWRGYRTAPAAACLGTVALVVSGARAAWVGALLAALVYLVVRRPRPRLRASLAAAAIAAAAIVALALATGVGGRVASTWRDTEGGGRGRLDEWRVAARVVARHPWLGVGPEGYRIAFGRAVDDRYEMAHGRDPLPDRAHSALLDIAATTGLPGLAAYLVLLFVVGRSVLRAMRDGPLWAAGIAVGLVGYGAQSLFLFPVAELEPVAWLLAGIVVGTNTGRGWARSRRALVAAGLAALAALAVLAAGTLDVAADHRARTLGSGGTGPRPTALRPDAIRYYLAEARAGQPDAARKALERALDLWPRDPIVRLEHARLLLEEARGTGSTATLAQARAELERLSRDDPRNAAVLLRLGVARALAKDAAGAERAWLRAERLAPRSGAAAVNLAIAYAQAGDWPKARAAAQRALALDPANEVATQILNTNGT